MKECMSFLGHYFGHKYEPRYDTTLPGDLQFKHGSVAVIEAIKNSIYRGDVCKRCGDTVNTGE